MPKRPEITPADFAKALEDQPLAVIPFEPQIFGTAANNGQMIAEVSSGHKTAEMFRQLAQMLTGRAEAKQPRGGLLSPLLAKLMKRSAQIPSVGSVGVTSCSVSVAQHRSPRRRRGAASTRRRWRR